MGDDFLSMTKTEFLRRFTAKLVSLVGPTYFEEDDPEPHSTIEYAEEVAPSYYEDTAQRAEGPEQCAQDDYSCWGD
jgi:hypothetical protein